MKKVIALLLSLMLMVGVALPVMAEEASHKHTVDYDDTMSVSVVIPEGYTIEESVVMGSLLLVMTPIDDANNYFCTIIAHDDELADVDRLNDVSDEDLQAIAAEFCADLNDPTVSYAETGMGTKLMIIDDNGVEDADTAIIVTVYKGYYITTYIFPLGAVVTDAEKDIVIQFYTDMEFHF